jgi:SAM-dependent methyltransferase
MNKMYFLLFKIRALIMRFIFPAEIYDKSNSLLPISNKYGFDRGNPIDRYYIERFLDENKKYIKGNCLEIHDNAYTLRFGGDKVQKADALDVDINNKQANIHSDLKNVHMISDAQYDTLLITHTVGMIDDFQEALKECWRLLKPGGTLLLTAGSIAPVMEKSPIYWRFTVASFNYIVKKHFINNKKSIIRSYGNVFAARAFLAGMSVEDVGIKKLNYNDNRFPIIISAIVVKK